MKEKIIREIKHILKTMSNPIISVLPAQLAFSLIITIISLFAILGFIVYLLSVSPDNLIDFVTDTFPSNSSSLILPLIKGRGFDFGMLFFIISSFVLSSGGAYAVIKSSNLIYDTNVSSSTRKRIKSFLMTIIFIFLILFLILVPGFGNYIIHLFENTNFFGNFLYYTFYIVKYPLSFLFIFFCIKLIYTIAPDVRIKSNTVTEGALFTTISWILLTRFYSFYASNLIRYDIIYGSLSNLIVLILWVYLLSYCFVVGIALNVKNNK